MESRFGNSNVRSRHSAVECSEAFVAVDALDSMERVVVEDVGLLGLELHASFDEPDGLGGGNDDETSADAGDDRGECAVLGHVKVVAEEVFRVSVGEEADGAGRDDTKEMRTQSSVEASDCLLSLKLPDMRLKSQRR